jgi:hypothetical protein
MRRIASLALVALTSFGSLAALGCEDNLPPETPDQVAADAPPQDVAVQAQPDAYADTDPSALTDFRATLDPHGTWVESETYGTVWMPNAAEVGPDFEPYVSGGHWAYDDDYVWVSDYEWGWAPFHYGRWVWEDGRGWLWIPGRVYAGAWVEWRVGDDVEYVGWAPMPPIWVWRGGMVVSLGFYPPAPFVFCGRGEVFEPGIRGHIVDHEHAVAIGGRTRIYDAPGGDRHVLAQPHAGGPPPRSLGYAPDRVPHAPAGDPGLQRAHAFSSPSTAAAMGAHAPASHTVKAHATPARGAPRGGVRSTRGRR